MRTAHADGAPCVAVGLCVPCTLGDHARCNDVIAIIGCACACTIEVDD